LTDNNTLLAALNTNWRQYLDKFHNHTFTFYRSLNFFENMQLLIMHVLIHLRTNGLYLHNNPMVLSIYISQPIMSSSSQ